MRYIIEGTPVPLQRVRFMERHCWDAQKQLKTKLRIILEAQHDGRPLYTGALRMEFWFYFPFKQSLSEAKKAHQSGRSHIFKPDLSNLIKLYEDISTGILYHDDCIIAEIIARKCYDAASRTEFEIIQLER
jgi:Holliday junction resolvase RusA-like endonuclease